MSCHKIIKINPSIQKIYKRKAINSATTRHQIFIKIDESFVELSLFCRKKNSYKLWTNSLIPIDNNSKCRVENLKKFEGH